MWTINDDLKDAMESPFAERVFPPFEAEDREDAIAIIKKKLREDE